MRQRPQLLAGVHLEPGVLPERAELELLERPRVDADDADAAPAQERRRRPAGEAEAVHDDCAPGARAPRGLHIGQRNLRVEMATSANSKAMIQNRTMILGS